MAFGGTFFYFNNLVASTTLRQPNFFHRLTDFIDIFMIELCKFLDYGNVIKMSGII